MGAVMTKTWGISLAAAMVMALSGCGTETATDEPRTSGNVSAELIDVQRAADEILAEMGGNAEQREARLYLAFKEANDPYEECMQAHGIDFVAKYHTSNVGFLPNGTSGEWMGALQRKPSEIVIANAEAAYDDATGRLPAKYQTPQFDEAQASCDESRPKNSIMDISPVPSEASASYAKMLASVDKELGPIEPYTECMLDAGVDYTKASNGEQGWAGLYMYLSAMIPRPPLPGDEPSKAWSAYLELEQRSLDADTKCRAAQYEKGLELLAPKIDQFREEYGEVLKASQERWEGFATEAKAEGFIFPG
jgi:hypothetical protein